MSQSVVQGEAQLIHHYRTQLAEIGVLAVGFIVGLAVLGGAVALASAPF